MSDVDGRTDIDHTMWMGCPSHMDPLEQGNTFGPSLLDFQKRWLDGKL